jgi:WXXGXW repeat (2 copies)
MLKLAHMRNFAILVAACLLTTACVVAPTPRGLYIGPAVAVAPPPPRVEYYGVPPAAGYFWIGGYWRWNGYTHVWVGGHWQAPRPGFRWMPRRWVHGRDGWHMRGGRWVRRYR